MAGRLDAPGVDRVESRFVASVVPQPNNAILDLSRVEFVSSLGIRMLISAARALRARQSMLVVYGAPASVADVFRSVSLQKIVPICATEGEALAAIAFWSRAAGV